LRPTPYESPGCPWAAAPAASFTSRRVFRSAVPCAGGVAVFCGHQHPGATGDGSMAASAALIDMPGKRGGPHCTKCPGPVRLHETVSFYERGPRLTSGVAMQSDSDGTGPDHAET